MAEVIDFDKLNPNEQMQSIKLYKNNSHIKSQGFEKLVIIKGYDKTSKLLDKAVLLSKRKLNKIGRNYNAVSPEMEDLLGISGSIQRSIPPRFVTENNLKNLKKLLKIK